MWYWRARVRPCMKSRCWTIEAVTHGREGKNKMSEACQRRRLSYNAMPLRSTLGVILLVKRSLWLLRWFKLSNEDKVKWRTNGFGLIVASWTDFGLQVFELHDVIHCQTDSRALKRWWTCFRKIVQWVNNQTCRGNSPIKSNLVGGENVWLGLPECTNVSH